jgi:hypothetical protein
MHDPPLLQAKAQSGEAKITESVPCEVSLAVAPCVIYKYYDAPHSTPS